MVAQDPLVAHRQGCKALALAIDASERLAMYHADILLHRRFGSRPAARSSIGVRIDPVRFDRPLQDLVDRDFARVEPDRLWVTDIERHEAFLNLAVVKGHRHVLVAASALKLRAA